ncbi:MerR family transcriptional regulator [Allosediminivita pacifica]|uniref:MerR-like DNA binding protein n=1 Tax=Allosediminivita pacifica TaxID=1267769 RepID=A0A2T6B285_9RHOB|nr:MerR family transcriptional regulator [Allosediminivita pacifica]PTX50186.1 MerR-like DNA binding protein [Allosediminivita pacifica]GGB02062.1 hypothetical protein GCM10011324_10410 [Allosediminivita pacifica]
MAPVPKSRDAFRTISEVAEWLDTPAHVLRFWESKFTQVKPVKRAGGRRYYRPADMELIGGIKRLLHEDGMTIKGVQKLLREQGVRHVASLSPYSLDGSVAGTPVEDAPFTEAEAVETVVPFARSAPAESEQAPQAAAPEDPAQETLSETAEAPAPADTVMEAAPAGDLPEAPAFAASAEPLEEDSGLAADAAADVPAQNPEEEVAMSDLDHLIEDDNAPDLPLFDTDPAEPVSEEPEAVEPEAPDAARAPLVAREIAPITPRPGVLSQLARVDSLSARQASQIAGHVAALQQISDRMSATRA